MVRTLNGRNRGDEIGDILFEGTLLGMAIKAKDIAKEARSGLRISLPDRRVRPYSFQDEALSNLIDNIPKNTGQITYGYI